MTAEPAGFDLDESALFEIEMPPPVSLADKFLIPPMSVLDRRSGAWQDRKRKWLALGIASDEGRDGNLTWAKSGGDDPVSQLLSESGGTSIFDPVLCEVAYRWFSRVGDRVLDPFAGGSVRGIAASTLGRYYLGIDIREEQVDANREQRHLGSDITPHWIVGDATRLDDTLTAPGDDAFDLVFTCPPYGDLEVYSDHPRDISTWTYDEFLAGQAAAIRDSTKRLNANRYAVWVTSDLRGPDGAYRGLVKDTIDQFAAAGLPLLNEVVLVDPVGTGALRAERPFRANRKMTRCHQVLLVFVKGDIRAAARRVEDDPS